MGNGQCIWGEIQVEVTVVAEHDTMKGCLLLRCYFMWSNYEFRLALLVSDIPIATNKAQAKT
jgi:hypothetical protein